MGSSPSVPNVNYTPPPNWPNIGIGNMTPGTNGPPPWLANLFSELGMFQPQQQSSMQSPQQIGGQPQSPLQAPQAPQQMATNSGTQPGGQPQGAGSYMGAFGNTSMPAQGLPGYQPLGLIAPQFTSPYSTGSGVLGGGGTQQNPFSYLG